MFPLSQRIRHSSSGQEMNLNGEIDITIHYSTKQYKRVIVRTIN